MSREMAVRWASLKCFPRVSGDEPLTIGEVITLEEFSPRERG